MHLRLVLLLLTKKTLSSNKNIACTSFIMACLACWQYGHAQNNPVLRLSEAVKNGLNSYQTIQAKSNYIKSSTALVQHVKNQYLPDVIGSLQEAYGTVNGQFG